MSSMDSSGGTAALTVEETGALIWSDMNSDVMELVFSKLPESAVFRAGSVCKRWHSIAQASTFIQFYVNEESSRHVFRFTVKGVKYSLKEDAGRFVFDSDGNFRSTPTFPCPEDGRISSQETADGSHYAFSGLRQTTVHYKLCLLEKDWRKTSELPYEMQDPIVGVVRSGNSDHKLVFAGGLADIMEEDDDLAVSIYDPKTNSWEHCESLPNEFRGSTSSLFMSSVVLGDRFFVYDMFSGFVSELNLISKRWSEVRVLRPAGDVNQLFLVAQSNHLRVLVVQDADDRNFRFNVWNVDDENIQLGELLHSTMVLNTRAAPPSAIMRWASKSLDPLARAVGILVILVIHCMFLCHSLTIKGVCLLQGHVTRANLRLTASLPTLRRSVIKNVQGVRVTPPVS